MRPQAEKMRSVDMEFTEEPLEAKRFGINWIKYRIIKYPQIAIIAAWVPFVVWGYVRLHSRLYRDTNAGIYVPNVFRNRYIVVRPDSWLLETTPERFRN